MAEPTVFDMPHATRLTEARQAFLDRWFKPFVARERFTRAIDVGCGVGYFSTYLKSLGLDVVGVDGRAENVADAQRRVPGARFVAADVQDRAIRELGLFDVVLCVGLLYHLENPFAVIRNLHALTGRLLIIESVVIPSRLPTAALLGEPCGRDQALGDSVFVLSRPALIKMLYRAGFRHVYEPVTLPDHDDFRDSPLMHRRRTVIVAAKQPVDTSELRPVSEPTSPSPWERQCRMRLWRAFRRLTR
jgi:SAM-dependent methyltransferase